jgi:hypothetical protein
MLIWPQFGLNSTFYFGNGNGQRILSVFGIQFAKKSGPAWGSRVEQYAPPASHSEQPKRLTLTPEEFTKMGVPAPRPRREVAKVEPTPQPPYDETFRARSPGTKNNSDLYSDAPIPLSLFRRALPRRFVGRADTSSIDRFNLEDDFDFNFS